MRNLLSILLLFTINTSFACRCIQPKPLQEAYNNITDIVEVKVVKIEGDGELGNNIIVEVINVFKGQCSFEQLTVLTNRTSCRLGLTLGNSYLIYDEIKSNQLGIHLCSRITCSRTTKMLNSEKRTEKAESELAIIKQIESQGKPNPNIYGHWKLEKIVRKDTVLTPSKRSYKLNITQDNIFYNLEVNSCQTRAFSITDSVINMKRALCTKACCDGRNEIISNHIDYNGSYQIIDSILIITTKDGSLYLQNQTNTNKSSSYR
jgi:hypothetical protein